MAAQISPQFLAVGESDKSYVPSDSTQGSKPSYAAIIQDKQQIESKIELYTVNFDNEDPVIQFTMEDVDNFTKEEGLHQAVVLKFSYGRPDISEVRRLFSSQFDVKGHCNVGLLEFRHILVRFDIYNDYVQFLSKSTAFIKSKGDEYFFRTFPWSIDFNPKEETSKAVVWISLPGLPPNLFAKRSIMSIASAVGKPLAVDKATHDRSRPSAARVKVIVDLLDKLPNKVILHIVDSVSGKSSKLHQQIVYDNLPKYCTHCKHQGHDEKTCRHKNEKPASKKDEVVKMQGDARDFLNEKKNAKGVIAQNEAVSKEGGGPSVSAAQQDLVKEKEDRRVYGKDKVPKFSQWKEVRDKRTQNKEKQTEGSVSQSKEIVGNKPNINKQIQTTNNFEVLQRERDEETVTNEMEVIEEHTDQSCNSNKEIQHTDVENGIKEQDVHASASQIAQKNTSPSSSKRQSPKNQQKNTVGTQQGIGRETTKQWVKEVFKNKTIDVNTIHLDCSSNNPNNDQQSANFLTKEVLEDSQIPEVMHSEFETGGKNYEKENEAKDSQITLECSNSETKKMSEGNINSIDPGGTVTNAEMQILNTEDIKDADEEQRMDNQSVQVHARKDANLKAVKEVEEKIQDTAAQKDLSDVDM